MTETSNAETAIDTVPGPAIEPERSKEVVAAFEAADNVAGGDTLVSTVQTTENTFATRLEAFRRAVSLVRDEADIMSTSGDLATASAARRTHILAEAVLFILSEPPSKAEPGDTPYVSTGFEDKLAAADAAAN